jgi:type I restriction enzyme M protein
VLSRLKDDYASDIRLILLIDEIDIIRQFRMEIQQKLRSLFQTFLEVKAVITGTLADMDEVRGIPTSPFFNMFQTERIRPLTEAEARELVTGPMKGRLTFTRDAVDFILTKSERKPYCIQAICKHLVDAALRTERDKITLRDVKRVYESVILDADFAHCFSIWESLPFELRADVIQAANAAGNGFELSKETLIELRKIGLLSDGASDSTLPSMFTDWLRKNVAQEKRMG